MSKDLDFMITEKCRVCESRNLKQILDLGRHPLSNSLKNSPNDKEKIFPLNLLFCQDCSLVQLSGTIQKEILFSKYVWITGTSMAARGFAEIFKDRILAIVKVNKKDIILEIASNDGTFLKPWLKEGYKVIGCDPAKNIAETANIEGINTICRFWDCHTAEKVAAEYGKIKIIFARNVIAHVSELFDVIKGINICLHESGIGVIEYHYASRILEGLQYDSIYHEHLCYLSLKPIEALLRRFDLHVFHIDYSPISGGALVVYFSKQKHLPSSKLIQLREQEDRTGINTYSRWRKFGKKCLQHKAASQELLSRFANKKVVGFGASARSSTYLNFCGFDSSEIIAIIDNNHLKQGLYSAGSSIPIVSFTDGMAIDPELVFIFAWNFKNEIITECRNNGYKQQYVIPFPKKPNILPN